MHFKNVVRLTCLKFLDFPCNISKIKESQARPNLLLSYRKDLLSYRKTRSFDKLILNKVISRQLKSCTRHTYPPKSAKALHNNIRNVK